MSVQRYLRRIRRQSLLTDPAIILHYDVASSDLRAWFWYVTEILPFENLAN